MATKTAGRRRSEKTGKPTDPSGLQSLGGSWGLRVFLESLVVYGAAWGYLWRLQFLTPYMPGTDGYYHIKVAWLIRTLGLMDTFPWATQSMWAERFYDNALGFHLALIPFTFGDLMTGAKLAAVTYGAALFASFYAVLRLRRVRLAGLWVFLLAASGGYFAWRVSLPRPHLLALVFSIWGLYFVIERRWVGTAIVGLLYSFSYLAPMLPVYACVYAFFCLVLRESFPWRVLAAAFGGVALGWLVHPHFLSNFYAGVPVAVSLPASVLGSAWGVSGPELFLAGEGHAANTDTFLTENIVTFSAALVSIYALSRSSVRFTADLLTLVFVALAFFVAACLTVRFIEYFVPLSLLACAEIIETGLRSWRTANTIGNRRRVIAALTVAAFAICAFALGDGSSRLYLSHPSPSKRRFAAEWFAKNTPPNSIVFTCDWDDTPELFFYNHSNRYLVFLDPTYLYRWNPQRWKTWRIVARGRDRNPLWTLQETFGARYGFCTSAFTGLRKQLEADPRASIPLEADSGYVFEIRRPRL
jgi:hypothetical protein